MSSASNAGSRSRSSASASRSRVVRRPRRGRRHRADLAGPDRQPAGVERRRPARASTSVVAVPAQVEHRALRRRAGRASAAARPRCALVCTTRSRPAGGVGREREAAPRAPRRRRPGRGRRRPASPGRPGSGRAAARRSSRPCPAPTTATRSPTSGAASHSALTAVSTVPASTARSAGTPSGTTCTAVGRHDVARLVRVRQKTRAAAQVGRARPRPRRR